MFDLSVVSMEIGLKQTREARNSNRDVNALIPPARTRHTCTRAMGLFLVNS